MIAWYLLKGRLRGVSYESLPVHAQMARETLQLNGALRTAGGNVTVRLLALGAKKTETRWHIQSCLVMFGVNWCHIFESFDI